MSDRLGLLRVFKIIGLIWVLGVSMSASASFFGFGKESWKEEVLLHDGSKIVIERSQTRGGNHEIGQEVPIAEHKISCTLPGTHEAITWKSTYGSATNNSGLILLALDVFNGVPYIVTTTTPPPLVRPTTNGIVQIRLTCSSNTSAKYGNVFHLQSFPQKSKWRMWPSTWLSIPGLYLPKK